MIASPSLRPRRPSSRCQSTRGPSLLLKHHPDQRIFRPLVDHRSELPVRQQRACGREHHPRERQHHRHRPPVHADGYTTSSPSPTSPTFNVFATSSDCRAELRLCVCDRFGGEWDRDRRGRECDGYGRTCEWDGGLERGVGVCVSASSFFPSIISHSPSHKLTGPPPSTSPILNARATLRALHQVRRSVLFECSF
ncbi:hypothetical protein B0H11DRAFT_801300 [Mycena galericulata]|nr:hypothetical protein B0H11DRAFT_801300 [Mycena galericulata]